MEKIFHAQETEKIHTVKTFVLPKAIYITDAISVPIEIPRTFFIEIEQKFWIYTEI